MLEVEISLKKRIDFCKNCFRYIIFEQFNGCALFILDLLKTVNYLQVFFSEILLSRLKIAPLKCSQKIKKVFHSNAFTLLLDFRNLDIELKFKEWDSIFLFDNSEFITLKSQKITCFLAFTCLQSTCLVYVIPYSSSELFVEAVFFRFSMNFRANLRTPTRQFIHLQEWLTRLAQNYKSFT